ncbi:RNA polymerase sigma factor [Flavobacterium sp. NKUCC04_CG]|uniref:RNA polymerase sigma factor n=1 Tax=Flavobacterium sp. NKUCC04_CG TaxID=2842121 RepID=UPI001C5AEB0C|nr:sigma-70 family RNA polymerase sigma factor [Flavobacterium sp. NKUCC04_CG]MBW3520051.1 sigma-70 family RNA polymerase sigma factor [Flavobacterium sp. NKUCC04_CG]
MNQTNNTDINKLTHHLFRENSGKMMGVLSKVFGAKHLDIIADAVQDTFETAVVRWRFSGVPENPSAWLMKVAKNKTINAIKRTKKWERPYEVERAEFEGKEMFDFTDEEIMDSQLQLLLLCCRADLSQKNQIAISLHVLCGFGVSEISNALLMSEEAVKKAITRIKALWRTTQTTRSVNSLKVISQQDKPILEILYLMFNEGYKVTKGKDGINLDLCFEAIRLTKLLLLNRSSHFETRSLLALMFLNIARFPARISEAGYWLTLEEQDRSLWNKTYMEEGIYYLQRDASNKVLNVFYIEALIVSLHCLAAKFEETNWQKIVVLYKQLEVLKPNNFIVWFNRIIAESFLGAPEKSLQQLAKISRDEIKNHEFTYYTGLAYLYVKTGNTQTALELYNKSLPFANTQMDELFIMRRISDLIHQ